MLPATMCNRLASPWASGESPVSASRLPTGTLNDRRTLPVYGFLAFELRSVLMLVWRCLRTESLPSLTHPVSSWGDEPVPPQQASSHV